ncbi:PAS domain-containing methyl-accepting chemotaxis protein [Chitinimonas viridis]|uniref:PAS domain-containing methyl-accepting chemotaxis protein n=1 Tax=Chitinimonas viridis TaxID=664880 RepID=A0ABT8B9D2_9NEIS|nr:PAS domain-containing methyl-accepting chemotaxis protein [Chitinimonas viridis]MDN3578857.1 PAS domain-containing methyl-accepting chemotaxis protein [Chitinimonas viridis]
MRKNLPVTEVEHHLDPKRPVVTKTDLKGIIRYANPAFIEISGFQKDELLGSSHNLVRHPDMPPEAFADMWRTLQSDLPWRGLVKNRCKNGDYYWVEAYATPLYEQGQKVGYMSVRNRPDAAEVRRTDALYRAINQKQQAFPATRAARRIPMAARMLALALVPVLLMDGLPLLGSPFWLTAFTGLVVAGGLGVWTWLGMQVPLQRADLALRKLSEGDFRFELDTDAAREYAQLLNGLKSMQINLRAVMSDVVSAADSVSDQSRSVNQEVADVVHRGNQQSDGIASVAAALEQLSVSVNEISEATTRSSHHAQTTMTLVGEGVGAMHSTLSVSHELVERVHGAQDVIDQLSHEVLAINKVTLTIKEIADQTNLLALNAAIEAARAGETGRGFAVVADEVRKLAERTTQSTTEIATTIGRIVGQTNTALSAMQLATGKVEESTRYIHQSHAALDAIKISSEEVSASAQDIANMLSQQSQASGEVARSMERMSALTEENSNSMGAAGGSVEQLSETAGELHLLVKHFERGL